MKSVTRFIKETAVGLAGSITPAVKRLENAETEIREERHELHESLMILNAMRAMGGVRRVTEGNGDNGEVQGHIPDRVAKHMALEELHEHITNGTNFSPEARWGQYGPVVTSDGVPEKRKFSVEEVARAQGEINSGRSSTITIQDELFG